MIKKLLLLPITLNCVFSIGQDFDWAKQFAGNTYAQGLAVTTDNAGNVYTTGTFSGVIDFDPGAGDQSIGASGDDVFISKLDASGNFVWAKVIGSVGTDVAWAIATDNTGNIYLTGYFLGTVDFDPGAGTANMTSLGASDVFILKLDTNGDFVWVKTVGGTDNEEGNCIRVDASNNVYISGTMNNGTVDFDPGPSNYDLSGYYDTFILKLDASGDFVWAKKFDCPIDLVHIYAIELDASGNVYSSGRFLETTDFDPGAGTSNLTANDGTDIFVCKLNSAGDFQWVKQIIGTEPASAYGLDVDAGNNIYLTGRFSGTADFDPGAGTANLTSFGDYDIFVCRLNSTGDYVWANKFGGTTADQAEDIAVSSNGNIYVTGAFNTVADFDPTSGTNYLISNGSADAFCLKLNSSGTFLSVMQFGGAGNDWGQALAIDVNKNVLLTGWFSGTADLNPTTTVENFTAAGSNDPFVVRLKIDDLGEDKKELSDGNFTLYPNPATNQINIIITDKIEQVTIYNIAGELVQSENKTLISIENLERGIYIVLVKTEKGTRQLRFVKE